MRSAIGFVALVAAACGGHPQKETTPAQHDAMDAARRAVETWRQAWEADSYDAIAPLYAHDKDTVVVSQGVSFPGWDQADAHFKDVLGHAREIHVKLADVTIDAIDDDCAVVVASMNRDISDGAVTTSEKGVLTLVLHRDATRWVVVSEHYSYPHSA
jgi:ketosteroid isomerase-like protein